MASRSVATIIGFVGGVLVLLGGLFRFLVLLPRAVTGSALASFLSAFSFVIGALVLGVLIVWLCRPRLWWWPGRRLFNGILLVVVGAVTWFLLGAVILTVIGAVLAILAGILLPFERLLTGAWRPRRSPFHRWV